MKGRQSFIQNRGIHFLCEITIKQTFQAEDALKLLLNILTIEGTKCWAYHSGPEDFNNLLMKFCREFAILHDDQKFELCDVIRTIIRSFPKNNFDEEQWLPLLQRGPVVNICHENWHLEQKMSEIFKELFRWDPENLNLILF